MVGSSDRWSTGDRVVLLPIALLAALAMAILLLPFVAAPPDEPSTWVPVGLEALGEGELSGVDAVVEAIELTRHAVENASPGDDGLLAGDLVAARARLDQRGSNFRWTVALLGPIRVRPNTTEEFRVDEGMILIELSAVDGEIAGLFSAGSAFQSPDAGSGFLRSLGVEQEGFIEVPLRLVWPPQE